MSFSERQVMALPERQRLACSLRFGGSGPLMSYSLIASCMAITRQCAHKLVRRGTARLRAHGYETPGLREQAG